MLLELSLNGEVATQGSTKQEQKKYEVVRTFLNAHPTARIIVVVDTHCLEDSGAFIWKGDTPDTYEGRSLLEVCTENCGLGHHLTVHLDYRALHPPSGLGLPAEREHPGPLP